MQRKQEFYAQFIGKRQGNIEIIRIIRTEPKSGKIWECQCDCGEVFETTTSKLSYAGVTDCPRCGQKKSKERSIEQLTTHGHSKERLYKIWHSMRSRCKYSGDSNYMCYGGRGISVCKEWDKDYMSFREWALEHGYVDNLSIDRINVNGNYCPDNCRWIPLKEQGVNRRSTQWITAFGVTKCQAEWAKLLGLSHTAFYQARKKGVDMSTYVEEHLALKEYVSSATGGGIKGNHIDMYVEDHQEALALGVRQAEVFAPAGGREK